MSYNFVFTCSVSVKGKIPLEWRLVLSYLPLQTRKEFWF
jgi:hypothetical protein